MMQSKPECVVIGAGMAGLMAATRLQEAGWIITVLDKGRGVGGRMATRRIVGATFDHGAQYFTVRSAEFAAFLQQWQQDNVAVEWAKGFPHAAGVTSTGLYARYRGADGMTSMPKALATNLTVLVSTRVEKIDFADRKWRLWAVKPDTAETEEFTADVLVMTPPAEQTLTLMRSGNVQLPDDIISTLKAITFNPCFAVLARLDAPSRIPEPGGLFMPGEPISWIADNQKKGISDEPAVTIHAGPEFTRKYYETNHDAVAQMLLEAAREFIGDATVTDYQVQRWRYSQPVNMHPEKTLIATSPAPVAFAGDAFDGAKVEGAALSGLAAAEKLLALDTLQ